MNASDQAPKPTVATTSTTITWTDEDHDHHTAIDDPTRAGEFVASLIRNGATRITVTPPVTG